MSFASITSSASTTTVRVLSTIGATADLVHSSVNAAAAVAQTLEAQALGYRDRTIADITVANKKLSATADQRAQVKVARSMMDTKRELDADPELAQMLLLVQSEWDKPNPQFALSIAA